MRSRTILVTGGAGFIGSALIRHTIGQTQDCVVNLDLLTYAGNPASLESVARDTRYQFIRGDIRDRQLVRDLLREYRVQAVVSCAAESHVDRSIEGPLSFVETNIVGTAQLLEAALAYWQSLDEPRRTAFRFLHVSTDEVYGSLAPHDARFSRQSRYEPNSPYAASKAAADHLVRAYHQTYGLPTLTINCSNNYGPYQFPEKLFPLIVLNCLEGKPLPVYGDGRQVRDWLFVEDHARAMHSVLDRGAPGQVYLVGGDCERTNLQVVQAICDAVDRLCPKLAHRPCRSLIQHVEDRPGHDRRYAVDTSDTQRELGWEPAVRFDKGVERTVRWYLEHADWFRQAGGERERLGLCHRTGT